MFASVGRVVQLVSDRIEIIKTKLIHHFTVSTKNWNNINWWWIGSSWRTIVSRQNLWFEHRNAERTVAPIRLHWYPISNCRGQVLLWMIELTLVMVLQSTTIAIFLSPRIEMNSQLQCIEKKCWEAILIYIFCLPNTMFSLSSGFSWVHNKAPVWFVLFKMKKWPRPWGSLEINPNQNSYWLVFQG